MRREKWKVSHNPGILPLMQADSLVRIVALILLVVVVAIIFLRRKKKKDASDDEF